MLASYSARIVYWGNRGLASGLRSACMWSWLEIVVRSLDNDVAVVSLNKEIYLHYSSRPSCINWREMHANWNANWGVSIMHVRQHYSRCESIIVSLSKSLYSYCSSLPSCNGYLAVLRGIRNEVWILYAV